MNWVTVAVALVSFAADDTAADSVTLRDGAVIVGELVEPAPRGAVSLIVRRAWAREHLEERTRHWEAAERPQLRLAYGLMRDRLTAWRRDRSAAAISADDRITPWLDREIARLKDVPEKPDSPLMTVSFGRADVKSITPRPKAAQRLLRLAWTAGIPNPEALSVAELKQAIEGRGLDPSSQAAVSIDALLPPAVEPEPSWLIRRASTEVTHDPGLRFVDYQGLVLPEPAPGQAPDLNVALQALSGLKNLLDIDAKPGDPQAEAFRPIAARGRVGAVVTKLDIGPDMASANVEMALWVRQANGQWIRAGARSTSVRTDDLGADAGKDLEADPQVKSVFQVVEALGLGSVAPEIKRRSLSIGAATQKALGQTRTLAEADLAKFSLPVDSAAARPKPEARP
jgi:hypothetical protein